MQKTRQSHNNSWLLATLVLCLQDGGCGMIMVTLRQIYCNNGRLLRTGSTNNLTLRNPKGNNNFSHARAFTRFASVTPTPVQSYHTSEVKQVTECSSQAQQLENGHFQELLARSFVVQIELGDYYNYICVTYYNIPFDLYCLSHVRIPHQIDTLKCTCLFHI